MRARMGVCGREGLNLAFKYFTWSTLTIRLTGITQINVSVRACEGGMRACGRCMRASGMTRINTLCVYVRVCVRVGLRACGVLELTCSRVIPITNSWML